MSFAYAFIGYKNRFTATTSTLSATGVTSGYSVNSLTNWASFDYCSFDSGSNTITIDCGAAVDVDYFAMASHNLFSMGATSFVLKASTVSNFATSVTLVTMTKSGDNWSGSYKLDTTTALASQTIDGDSVVCFKLDSVNYRYYRLEFNNTSAARIGVLSLGQRTEFELGFYAGSQPPVLNEDVIVTNNKSESGTFLGRSIVRTGAKTQTINLDRLTHSWIYNTWLPFKQSAELNPFFYSWGNTPLYNNQLCYQTSFAPIKLQDRIGSGHGSVGITFDGVIR